MTRPRCRFCGALIAKETVTVFVKLPGEIMATASSFCRDIRVEQLPADKAACQRLVNEDVVSIAYSDGRSGIRKFTVWNRQNYVDNYFCKADHARRFGYALAAAGHQMKAHEAAVSVDRAKTAPTGVIPTPGT